MAQHDASAGPRPRPLGRWTTLTFFALLAGGALAAATRVARSPSRLELVCAAAWLLGYGVTLWGGGHPGVTFLRNPTGPAHERADPRAGGGAGVVLLFTPVVLALFASPFVVGGMLIQDWPPNHRAGGPADPIENGSAVALAVTALSLVGFAVFRAFSGGTARATIRTVLRAKDAPAGLQPGALGRCRGVVRDPTPIAVDNQLAAFALGTDEEVMPGSDPNIVVRSFGNVGTFFVEVGRTLVEVDPRGVLWTWPEKRRWSGLSPAGRSRTITAEFLPVGATVLLTGRADPRFGSGANGALRVSALAGDPVVLLRTAPDADWIPVFRAAKRRRVIAVVALFALAAATGLHGWTELAVLPPTHVTSSGDSD